MREERNGSDTRADADTTGSAAPRLRSELEHIIHQSGAVLFRWRHAEGRPVEFVTDNVRQFGFEPDGFYSERVRFLDLVHPDDRPRLAAAGSEHGGGDGYTEKYRLVIPSGASRWVVERTSVCRDASGRVTHLHGVVLDITERQQADEAVRRAQTMESVATLASGIAHDFNNLLTAIYGYTELARASLPEDHEAVEPLRMVEQAASQASGVTRSLLAFSRKSGAHKQPVNLTHVLTEGLRLLRYVLPSSMELLEDYEAEGEIWVRGDATQLQQVLMNLALNARDAMPEGGRLRIGLYREGAEADAGRVLPGALGQEMAVLTVEDSGTGMSREVRARIFEPFFSTKPRGQGTGLGLAVTYGIVTDHGGRVDVDSAAERGTTVRVRLPCCGPGPAALERLLDRELESGRGETLLVVDSDDHVRAIVTSSLRSRGYEVLQARDGVEAMQRLLEGKEQIRLITLDLPRLSGETCLRELRAAGLRVPVVVTTESTELVTESFGQEDVHVLRKPFQMADLAALIRGVLSPSGHPAGERV